MKKYFLLFTIFVLGLSSCVTLKPDSSNLSSVDYNGRLSVADAHYIKRPTPAGITLRIGAAAAGGYLGYKYSPIKYQDGDQTKSLPAVNAAVGALLGYTVTHLCEYAAGKGKRKDCTDPMAWLSKVDRKYTVCNTSSSQKNYFTAIPKTQESNFIVRNFEDVKDFKMAFPSSGYSNTVVKSAIPVVQRQELPQLLNSFPNLSCAEDVKKAYLEKSETTEQVIEAVNKYGDLNHNAEEIACNKIKSFKDAAIFKENYPYSTSLSKALINSFNTEYSSSENSKILSIYKDNYFYFTEKDFYLVDDVQKENYWKSLKDNSNISSFKKFVIWQKKYDWLKHKNLENNLLENAWKIGYAEYSNGDNLVFLMREIGIKNWGISKNKIEEFIDNKLKNEVSYNMSIKSTSIKRNTNPDYTRWRNSSYASFMVINDGEVLYLAYGEVINKSKFSLPIKLLISSDMRLLQEGGLMQALGYLLGAQGGKTWKPAGKVNTSYLCGYIRPNETVPYAGLYRLDGSLEKGYDFGIPGSIMSIQYAEKVELANHKVEIAYSKDLLTEPLRNYQNESLKYIKEDLPSTSLIDAYRGISYSESQNKLDREAEDIREAARRAEAERKSNIKSIEIKSASNAIISVESTGYLGIIDGSNSCSNPKTPNYSVIIKNKEDEKIKEFDNKRNLVGEPGNDADNSIYISPYDYPITIDISYKVCAATLSRYTSGKYVSATIILKSPVLLTILPEK